MHAFFHFDPFFGGRQTARRFSLVLNCLSFSLQHIAAAGVCVRPATRHMCRSVYVCVCLCEYAFAL